MRTARDTPATAARPRASAALVTAAVALGSLALVVTGLVTLTAPAADAAGEEAVGAVGGQMCGEIDATPVSGGAYTVQNNRYGVPDGQCVTARDGGFTVDQADGAIAPGGAPKSYPSLVAGCHWGRCSDAPGLPVQASEIGDARTAVSITRAPGSWNAAYDIWFSSTPDPQAQNDGTELMIWIDGEDAPDPIGDVVGTVAVAGATWDVWQGDMGWNVISFVHQQGATAVDLPLEPFVREAVERGAAEPDWWLTSVQFGFEPWSGGEGLAADGFSWTPASGAAPVDGPAADGPVADDGAVAGPTVQPDGEVSPGADVTEPAADALELDDAAPGAAALVRQDASGRCLDARGSGEPGDPEVALWDCDASQTWRLDASGDLQHEATGACLGPVGGDTAVGTPVQLQVCDNLVVQEWVRERDELINVASGLCLGVSPGATTNGAPIVLGRCTAGF